jgi:ribonuclease HII
VPDFSIELAQADRPVAGIDEAGRGPLAGPVVAAACILGSGLPAEIAATIDDSKKLTRAKRSALFEWLASNAEIGVGMASVEEIDAINILQATLLAMRRAVARLPRQPAVALIDGNRCPALSCRMQAVVGGDGLSLSIAAASIVAKVTRDRLMAELDSRYPGYGLARNAGYGTREHLAALLHLGVTPIHRRSFSPISQLTAIKY